MPITTTKPKKWGNGAGFYLPQSFMDEYHITETTEFEVETQENGDIVLHRKKSFDELLDEYLACNMDEAHDAGWDTMKEVGGEAW